MNTTHTHTHTHASSRHSFWHSRWALVGLVVAAGASLFFYVDGFERAKGDWTYLLLLLCPLMHVFMHGGHGHGHGHGGHDGHGAPANDAPSAERVPPGAAPARAPARG